MTNKYTLFIDTTNNYCYIAICCNGKILSNAKIAVNKNVTDIIVSTIHKTLKQASIRPLNLTRIILNIGPGSFTGIKVGVTIAKVWKLFNPKIEILTINSLLLQTKNGNGISVIDAKSNKYYLAIYRQGKELVKPCLIDKNSLIKFIKKYKNMPIIQDQTGCMYENFLKYIKYFKKVQDINYLEPLYLKNPV